MRVGVLGWGALGSAIGAAVTDGAVPGATLEAIGLRGEPIGAMPAKVVAPVDLGLECEVVVEAAGHDAVLDHVPGFLEAGCSVIVLSTGALRDQTLAAELGKRGSDRLFFSSGAIGGIDLIRACRHMGEIQQVTLTTSKPSHVLPADWMDDNMARRLCAGTERVECFRGSALEATRRFPASVNVAATLAIASGSWDIVDVVVIGDPNATGNRHEIDVRADAGRYSISIHNEALPSNPASSALVVGATLRGLSSLTAAGPSFV